RRVRAAHGAAGDDAVADPGRASVAPGAQRNVRGVGFRLHPRRAPEGTVAETDRTGPRAAQCTNTGCRRAVTRYRLSSRWHFGGGGGVRLAGPGTAADL